MDKKEILRKVKAIVKRELEGEPSGHDYWHCWRVAKLAERIGKEEKADIFVLQLAGFLHDVTSKKNRKDHNVAGAKEAERILRDFMVSERIIKKVKKCILNHRYSGKKIRDLSLEEKVIQDADKLDVLGAIGVARLFAFAGKFDVPMHEPGIRPDTQKYFRLGHSTTAINHFEEKIFKIVSFLHTKEAKIIARKREKYMHDFLRKFQAEWVGKQ